MSDFIHPECGGILYKEETDMRMIWDYNSLPVRIYDIEGNLKRIEEKEQM